MKVDVARSSNPMRTPFPRRRWKLYQSKQFRSIFEEYDRFTDRNIYAEDKNSLIILSISTRPISRKGSYCFRYWKYIWFNLDSFGPEYTFYMRKSEEVKLSLIIRKSLKLSIVGDTGITWLDYCIQPFTGMHLLRKNLRPFSLKTQILVRLYLIGIQWEKP